MQYFRNYALARLMHVSQATVGNWITTARQGKSDLQLHEQDGKHFVANTTKNLAIIETLVRENKKFKTTRDLKTIKPASRFYDLYSPMQIADIIANLTTYREMPLQYTYFDAGAEHWAEYADRLSHEETPNMLNRNIELLSSNLTSLERLLGGHRRINVIDLGVGNCHPVKDFLARLVSRGVLNRYIGIDQSKDMLSVARGNIQKWFGDKIAFEAYTRDMSRERFDDLLTRDYFVKDEEPPRSVVLLFGGTLANQRVPDDTLRLINSSMAAGDLFVYFMKLDTPNSRRFFDVPFDTQFRLPLDLLNLDPSWYEVERFFDEEQRARFIRVRLTVALSITFELDGGQWRVDFDKGDTILIWRYWHQTSSEVLAQLDRNGFNLFQASKTRDDEYLLTVCNIRADGR